MQWKLELTLVKSSDSRGTIAVKLTAHHAPENRISELWRMTRDDWRLTRPLLVGYKFSEFEPMSPVAVRLRR